MSTPPLDAGVDAGPSDHVRAALGRLQASWARTVSEVCECHSAVRYLERDACVASFTFSDSELECYVEAGHLAPEGSADRWECTAMHEEAFVACMVTVACDDRSSAMACADALYAALADCPALPTDVTAELSTQMCIQP